MNEANKKLLLDGLNQDFVKKNKILAIGTLVAALAIVLIAVLMKIWYFACFSIPFFAVAVFTFKNSKKFSDPKNLGQYNFSEEICTVKANELSTTGNIRYLIFSNDLRYDISFSEGSMYRNTKEGDHFLMVSDPKKNCILKLIPYPEGNPAVAEERSAPVMSKETLPGLSVSLKNMMDQNDRPIIVCNLLHQIAYLNKAAGDQNTDLENGKILLDLIDPANMMTVQKALVWFAESSENNKTAGWQDANGRQIDIYALRDNDRHLSGYYLQ